MDLKDFFILFLAYILFFYILVTNNTGIVKFIASSIVLLSAGLYFKQKYNLSDEMGFILLKARKGFNIIKNIAKFKNFWNFFSDLGLFFTLGFLGFFLIKWRNLKEKIFLYVLSIFIITIFLFLYPFSMNFLINLVSPQQETSSNFNIYVLIIPYIIGAMGTIYVSILHIAGITLMKLVNIYLFHQQATLHPSATLILPGINIPLIEGILALIFLLVVHESAHAVQVVISKIPLKSSGIVLFGVLPIGAFVEPDETKLKKSSSKAKSRIAINGPFINIIFSFLFAFIFFGFLFLTSNYTSSGCYVLSGPLEKGTLIYSINNISCSNLTKLPSNTYVELNTNKGILHVKTDANGKMNILYVYISSKTILRYYTDNILQFIYSLLGLLFSLNIIVGTINLLPITFFDGSMIITALFGDDSWITKFIIYSTTLCFLIMLLPNII